MQRLLAFIENNLHFILFLVLQVFSLTLVFKLNPYQRAYFSNSASGITSYVNNVSEEVRNFINLREGNRQLQHVYTDSVSKIKDIYQLHLLTDTFKVKDSSFNLLYEVVAAEVVFNSVHKAENVIVINKGRADGIEKGAGLISSEGIAGVVIAVGEHFSTAMSVLNTNFHIVPQINGQEFFTELIWNNQNPYTLKINKINRLENVNVGDMVTTGKSSLIFPAGIPIGKVTKLNEVEGSQYFDTEIETASNFRNLHYVFVVNNSKRAEIEEVMQDE
ncbi:MAG: rod shape-determining protein MreC [Bacteroidia bacterium]